ncbi:hypothetical protein G7085_04335 [Tessaracoccus sp. HDW20]|nr:hypothetical protein [Tessaracoccus coleopterorum]
MSIEPERDREDPTAAWRGVKQDIDAERAAGVGFRGPSRRLLGTLVAPTGGGFSC